MKARLKYPIFSFAPKGNMIYVFRKEELYTTTNTELLKKRKNYIVVDATGTKYVEKGAHKVKWQGIFGYCIRMQGRVISIEYEYGDNPEPFPLRKLQELVAERYPKTRWFKEECWNSADEFRQAIFACKTFEEVADILMPERKQINLFRYGTTDYIIIASRSRSGVGSVLQGTGRKGNMAAAQQPENGQLLGT